jgi:hypothetical protein
MLLSYRFSRSGGTGRRSRLKICRGSLPVWVRLPPYTPTVLKTPTYLRKVRFMHLCGFCYGWFCKGVQANEVKMWFLGSIVYTVYSGFESRTETSPSGVGPQKVGCFCCIQCIRSGKVGAGNRNRTYTALRPPDFESGASASSAIPARRIGYHSWSPGLFSVTRLRFTVSKP